MTKLILHSCLIIFAVVVGYYLGNHSQKSEGSLTSVQSNDAGLLNSKEVCSHGNHNLDYLLKWDDQKNCFLFDGMTSEQYKNQRREIFSFFIAASN